MIKLRWIKPDGSKVARTYKKLEGARDFAKLVAESGGTLEILEGCTDRDLHGDIDARLFCEWVPAGDCYLDEAPHLPEECENCRVWMSKCECSKCVPPTDDWVDVDAAERERNDSIAKAQRNKTAKPRATRMSSDWVITLTTPLDPVTGRNINPKKPGCKAHARFALYKTGMTVEQAKAAGITALDLQWDSQHGFIAVRSPNEEEE